MKWLTLIFIAANVAFIGWRYEMRIESAASTPPSATPLPPNTPSLTLLSEVDEMPPPRESPAPAIEPPAPEPVLAETASDSANDAPAETAPPRDEAAVAPASEQPSNHCVEIGPFASAHDATAMEHWLTPRAAALHRVSATVAKRKMFGVFLKPKKPEEVSTEIANLERRGVRDVLAIKRDDLGSAISLGVFRSQEAVNRRLAEITRQGYQPVVVPRIETTERHWLRANLATNADDPSAIPKALLHGASVAALDCAKINDEKIVEPAPSP